MVYVAAFLLGSIPFGYLVVRWVHGVDLRAHGSGNPGATNAARLWSRRWRPLAFLGIFLLDAGKGYVAAGVLPAAWPALAGLAAVLGHDFSPWLGLRGGKGVATTLGVFCALEPLATAVALAVFAVIWGRTRIVAAGSLGLAVALPVTVFAHGSAPRPVGLVAVALGALIVWRHRGNIGRLWHREAA
ncbi:MAG: glycerol-3-phosphate acyltransferase [Planctomycetota bacterium]